LVSFKSGLVFFVLLMAQGLFPARLEKAQGQSDLPCWLEYLGQDLKQYSNRNYLIVPSLQE
jgi:hypothetical protein